MSKGSTAVVAKACRRVDVSEVDPCRGAERMSGINLECRQSTGSLPIESSTSPASENRTLLPMIEITFDFFVSN